MRTTILVLCLSFVAISAADGAQSASTPPASSATPSGVHLGIVVAEGVDRKSELERSFRGGSLELSASLTQFVSRTKRGGNSTLPRLTLGFFVLPFVQVEVAARFWDLTSGEGLYTGRLALYFRAQSQKMPDLTPYVFGGTGLGISGPIDDDTYEVETVGGGLKVFLRENLALRVEYCSAYYSKAWGWFTSSTTDGTISLGLSLFHFR